MKRGLLGLLLWGGLWAGAGAQTVIEEYPDLHLPPTYSVVIKGRPMPAGPGGITWKEGRPFINRQEAAPLFMLSREGEPSLDLFALLKSRGYTVAFNGTDTLKCIPPARPVHVSRVEGTVTVEEYPELRLPARYNVVLAGRELPAGSISWKEGRPWVKRSEVAPTLQLSLEGEPSLDLFGLLKSKRFVVAFDGGESIRCSAPTVAAAASAPSTSSAGYQQAERAWNKMLATGKVHVLSRHPEQARVDRIGAAVAQACHRNVVWHFFIVQDAQPNAYCLGEGFVAVTTALLELGLSDDELAGVLSHEVAHGARQHLQAQVLDEHIRQSAVDELQEAQDLLERYQREYERQVAGEQEGSLNARMARDSYESKVVTVRRRISDIQKKAQYLHGRQVHASEFSQEQEVEADQSGMRYAVTAGYSAEGLISALGKIERHGQAQMGAAYVSGRRTHPPTARRIEILRKVLSSWKS